MLCREVRCAGVAIRITIFLYTVLALYTFTSRGGAVLAEQLAEHEGAHLAARRGRGGAELGADGGRTARPPGRVGAAKFRKSQPL